MVSEKERLKDKGSKLQVVAAGATAGLISRLVTHYEVSIVQTVDK